MGRVRLPRAVTTAVRVQIADAQASRESGERELVITTNTAQQASSDDPAFNDLTPIPVDRQRMLSLSDWTDVAVPIFKNTLIGPKGGNRTLTVHVEIVQAPNSVVAATSVDFSMRLDVGYRDKDERLLADQVLAIKIAVAVAAASHGVDEKEIAIIKRWIKQAADNSDEEQRPERRRKLSAVLRAATLKGADAALSVSKLVDSLQEDGSTAGKMLAIQLSLDVAAADGAAEPEELELIDKIAKKLDVDRDLLVSAREKTLATLASSVGANSEHRYAILGIDPANEREAIRLQLNALYRKWSSRATTLSDPVKRQEAEDMLKLIADARAELS